MNTLCKYTSCIRSVSMWVVSGNDSMVYLPWPGGITSKRVWPSRV